MVCPLLRRIKRQLQASRGDYDKKNCTAGSLEKELSTLVPPQVREQAARGDREPGHGVFLNNIGTSCLTRIHYMLDQVDTTPIFRGRRSLPRATYCFLPHPYGRF